MCMIILKPKGIDFPPEEHLIKSEVRNRDGIGIAYAKDGKVFIKKDFKDAEKCYAWMKDNLGIGHAILIHQRLGTSGLMDEGTRHPFPMTTDCELMRKENQECKIAFAHNGVFFGQGMDKKYSDSMLVLQKFFGSLGNLVFSNECVRELVLEFVGNNNKIAFLKHSGKFAIFGNSWIEHKNKCFYSNKSYEYTIPVQRTLAPIGFNNSNNNHINHYSWDRKKPEGLPYYGKPPEGKPKKKMSCDNCGNCKKSKWRGDRKLYICSKCYKIMHKEQSNNVSTKKDNICYYCQNKDATYYPDIQHNSCERCHKNELYYRNRLEEFSNESWGEKV